MKKLLISFGILHIALLSIGQSIIQESPVNPDFIKYLEESKSGRFNFQTKSGFGLGQIPSPLKKNFDAFLSSHNPKAAITDAKYDLRTAGAGGSSLLTSVKNQGGCGSCWTFATMGSIECRWKILGFGDNNLSEDNLNNCHGFLFASCEGGNLDMSTSYLSRKSGPMSETDDPYTATPNACPTGLTEQAYIPDVRYVPNDMNSIKQALIDYGALYTNLYYDDLYFNDGDNTYYYDDVSSTNHAVLLVGWDNNKLTAGGTGAWIIKNSWGTGWGENGFFYVSYNQYFVNF